MKLSRRTILARTIIARTVIARTIMAGIAVMPAGVAASPCCGPVSASGTRLAAFLDGTGVDHLWLPGLRVNWQTGEAMSAWDDARPHTHCSAFVASAAMRLGVYVLRPPEHGPTLLANAQMNWLRSPAAVAGGWRKLADVTAAQTRANLGELVVAAFENPDAGKPGHIAIVRPGDIDAAALRANGPFVTQAGGHNALSLPLARGFANHAGAWLAGGGGSVRFFAHEVAWASLGQGGTGTE